MTGKSESQKITTQQQRILRLLFKFRFTSAQGLAAIMNIRREGVYDTLETLTKRGLVTKVYHQSFRIDRKPAYYYLTKSGVTIVRKLLDVEESVVHTLYKNNTATDTFIAHCLAMVKCYPRLRAQLPDNTEIFTKTEINRFNQFPKNRPDLYLRTPVHQEAIVILSHDTPAYIARKRLDEIIEHLEQGEWDGEYPTICFILEDARAAKGFLYTTHKKLESAGLDESEIRIRATSLSQLLSSSSTNIWNTPDHTQHPSSIFL